MIFQPPFQILLVDDDPSIHELIETYVTLRYAGDVDVVYRNTLQSAREYIDNSKSVIHFAFCDIHLDDGRLAWDVIKECFIVEKGIQIVALSADQTLITAIESYNNGARYFLEKPIDKKELYRVIDHCIEHLSYWHNLIKKRVDK
ncbi:response regulator [Halobacteriovorax sp. GB3]|uniref:response regulator n=1 Tax=Halobacteriovorax sp. GB3 TaxID=2719615 RepID=UPI00235DFB68|nr:response regulator [Halobacteriovorax sp. GB3]MDD0853236.1 response regulator [Halobacteriovorax sp. GB3]